jgi:3-hydroxybutyryl-CoA dehydrogenase
VTRCSSRREGLSPGSRNSIANLTQVDTPATVVEHVRFNAALIESPDQRSIRAPGRFPATTTSSLPDIEYAAMTRRAQDVVGMHFFKPAQVVELREVVHTVSAAG